MNRRGFARLALVALLCCTLLGVLPAAAHAAVAGYVITNYDVYIVVNLDNSYDVTEIIDVEFTAQRHGIFRTIPIGTTSGFPAQIRNLEVQGGPFTVEQSSTQWNIRIGDPNRFAEQHMRYILRYTYYVGDDGIADYDEFYFNVIGTEWDTTIQNVTFRVEMPRPFDEEKLNITSGAYGSIANVGYVAYRVDGNAIAGRTVQPLQPGEGLTIAINLPQGYFEKVVERFDWTKLVGWAGYAAFPAITAGVLGLWFAWRRNKQIFPSVQFYPPEGLTSADVGFILDGNSTPKEITSLIIYWAGKGYLTIEENSKRQLFGTSSTYTFTKLRDLDPATAKPYERILFDRMFALGDGTTVTSKELENRFHQDITNAQHGVKAFFTDIEQSRVVAKTNVPFMITAGFLSFLAALMMIVIAAPFSTIAQTGFLLFLAFASVGAIVIVLVFYFLFKPFNDRAHAKFTTWLFAAIAGFFLLNVVLGIVLLSIGASWVQIASAALGLVAVALGGWALATPYKRTPLGDDLMGRLLGFREFLRVAEKPRIEMLIEENPSYFYDTLPFALVMGVTNVWANKFSDIAMEPPGWYNSDAGIPFAPIVFMNTMNTSLNTMSTVATSSPAQSGGSMGGGFSGGGFGGGGGGSW